MITIKEWGKEEDYYYVSFSLDNKYEEEGTISYFYNENTSKIRCYIPYISTEEGYNIEEVLTNLGFEETIEDQVYYDLYLKDTITYKEFKEFVKNLIEYMEEEMI